MTAKAYNDGDKIVTISTIYPCYWLTFYEKLTTLLRVNLLCQWVLTIGVVRDV